MPTASRSRASTRAQAGTAAFGLVAGLVAGCIYDTGAQVWAGPEGPPAATPEPETGSEAVVLDPRLALRFDRHLDPWRMDPEVAVRLSSGEVQAELAVRWDPVDRALYAWPTAALRPGLRYVFEVVAPAALPDLAGRILDEDGVEAARTVFVTADDPNDPAAHRPDGTDAPPVPPDDPDAFWRARVLAGPGACGGCHADGLLYPGTDLPLDEGRPLAGRPARTSPGRTLVVPGRPERSYLLHKVLADYPDIGGEPMPLLLDLSPAERTELARAVEAWILSL